MKGEERRLTRTTKAGKRKKGDKCESQQTKKGQRPRSRSRPRPRKI